MVSPTLAHLLQNPALVVMAAILVDFVALIAGRAGYAGKVVNAWWNQFTLGAFVCDVASMCFGVFLALFLFRYVLPSNSFSWTNLFILVVVIQMVHDLLFGRLTVAFPRGKNQMMDMFKRYVNDHSWKILLVDAAMMVGVVWVMYMFVTYHIPPIVVYTLMAFLLYIAQIWIYS